MLSDFVIAAITLVDSKSKGLCGRSVRVCRAEAAPVPETQSCAFPTRWECLSVLTLLPSGFQVAFPRVRLGTWLGVLTAQEGIYLDFHFLNNQGDPHQ